MWKNIFFLIMLTLNTMGNGHLLEDTWTYYDGGDTVGETVTA